MIDPSEPAPPAHRALERAPADFGSWVATVVKMAIATQEVSLSDSRVPFNGRVITVW
jgi:hypothetical protein